MLYQWSQQEKPAKGSMVWSTCCPERMAQTINLGFPPGVKGYGNIKVVGVCTRKRPGELLAVALPSRVNPGGSAMQVLELALRAAPGEPPGQRTAAGCWSCARCGWSANSSSRRRASCF